MKQTISEIIDLRLDQQALENELPRVARDPDACASWRNYHLIGDVIRGEVAGGTCLMHRVQGALDREPTVLMPTRNKTGAAGIADKTGIASNAARSAGLFAVAASLALVAVLTLSPQTSGIRGVAGQDPAGGPVATVQTFGSGSENSVPAGQEKSAIVQEQTEEFESEFGQMLAEHGEFTATSGLNGLIAYAKLVSNQQLVE